MRRFEVVFAYLLHYLTLAFFGITSVLFFKYVSSHTFLVPTDTGDAIALISYILVFMILPLALAFYFYVRMPDYSESDRHVLTRFMTRDLLRDLALLFPLTGITFFPYMLTLGPAEPVDFIFLASYVGAGIVIYGIQKRKYKNSYS